MGFDVVFTDIEVAGHARKIAHRGTVSDLGIIDVMFRHRQFHPSEARVAALQREYEKILTEGKVPLIIDAGANIGTSAIWFALTFPKSHIVAIEPDDDNFVYLALNARGLWVDLKKGAVADSNSIGSLVDPGRGDLGFMTGDFDGNQPLLRWGLEHILSEKDGSGMEPFILKCDIEGGEREVFSNAERWLDRFYMIVIEPHDWLLPGQATFANFLRAVGAFPRDFIFFGENVFSYRNG